MSFVSAQGGAADTVSASRTQQALNTALLRTELMVAALTCGSQPQYNAFVTKFQNHLSAQGRLLRAMFRQRYGRASEDHLNAFVTRLANQESRRSSAGRTDYCVEASQLFHQLLDDQRQRFETLVNSPTLTVRSETPFGSPASKRRGGDRAFAGGGDLASNPLPRQK